MWCHHSLYRQIWCHHNLYRHMWCHHNLYRLIRCHHSLYRYNLYRHMWCHHSLWFQANNWRQVRFLCSQVRCLYIRWHRMPRHNHWRRMGSSLHQWRHKEIGKWRLLSDSLLSVLTNLKIWTIPKMNPMFEILSIFLLYYLLTFRLLSHKLCSV